MCWVCVCERVFNLSLCLFGFIERSYCLAIVGVTPTPTPTSLPQSLSLLACEHVSMAWHRCLDLGTWAQGSDQWAVVLWLSLSLSLGCHGQHNRGACHETALRLASTCRLSGHAAAAVVIVAVAVVVVVAVAAWDLFSSAATCVTYCFAYCLFYFVFFMAYYLLFIYLPVVIVMAM